jgi:hypothetical protein
VQEVRNTLLLAGKNGVVLLEGSQGSLSSPSDKNRVKVKDSYQKVEWAKPGYLLVKRCSLSLPAVN